MSDLVPAPEVKIHKGRLKGTPNKRTTELMTRLNSIGCDPLEITARIALGDVPCGTCHGIGKTKFQAKGGYKTNGFAPERVCQSCWGDGKEKVITRDRLAAASELLQYLHPKRKAIEVTGEDGEPIRHAVLVKFVEPDTK